MEKNSRIMFIVSIAISVLVIATALLPAVLSVGEENAHKYNTGSYFALVGEDEIVHTITISPGEGSFVITTDDKVDITPSMGTYNPGGVYVSPAIAIGVYEAYNDDGVLTSQAGVTPTGSRTIDEFRTLALAGNTDNMNGTYQLWNYYQYVLYKIMATSVMGNTDSQYIMGPGVSTGSASVNTGETSSAYTKSAANTDSVSMFIENAWGNVWDFVGDTSFNNYVMSAGNTLGGHTINAIENTLIGTYTLPSGTNASWIDEAYTAGEAWLTPKAFDAVAGTDGESTNDRIWTNSGQRLLFVGGDWIYGAGVGLSAFNASNAFSFSYASLGARLAYVLTEDVETSANYGYVITFASDGNTISNVQALVDGTLTDENPTGTTLNSYWDFDTETGIGPFGAYYVAINLADVDTESDTDYLAETMLGTKKGQVAYVLDPTDWTKTLGGTSYTSGNYNIMLVVPTVYWGVSDSKLYMSNSPDTFSDVEGLEMAAYAHTYTVDPSVDTGNPVTTASATVVYGEDYIVRLYSTGDVYLITNNAMTYLGQASGENSVELTVTGDVLGYTPSGGSAATIDDTLAYIAASGEMVQCKNPYYSTSQEASFIIGGYANNLSTTEGDVVDIGYCLTVDTTDLSMSSIVVLDPVSDASNTVDTNGAVWEDSTRIVSDLYTVGDLKITTTWSDSGTSTATYNYYLAPYDVIYKNPTYVDNSMWSILLILVGTLSLIGVVLFTVRGIGGRE